MARAKKKTKTDNSAKFGFEANMFLAADKLRDNMDASEYKHIVLGLIIVKYIPDALEAMRYAHIFGTTRRTLWLFLRIAKRHN